MFMNMMTPVGTSVVLVDLSQERAAQSKLMLTEQGYSVIGQVQSADEIPNILSQTNADVIVMYADDVDPSLLSSMRDLPEPLRRPTVLFSSDGSSSSIHAAVAAGVNAYVVVGVDGNRMRSAIDLAKANYSNTTVLREELDEAREALKERKMIERAKGIIMKQKGIDEAAAYDLLRKRSMLDGQRLIDVARVITQAADVMDG